MRQLVAEATVKPAIVNMRRLHQVHGKLGLKGASFNSKHYSHTPYFQNIY